MQLSVVQVITCGNKILVRRGGKEKEVEVEAARRVEEKGEEAEEVAREQGREQGREVEGRVSCTTISPSGLLLAACDDSKQVGVVEGGVEVVWCTVRWCGAQ